MSLHNKPEYNPEPMKDALAKHGLPVSTPSQNADSFRLGWASAVAALPGLVKPLEWHTYSYGESAISKCGVFRITKNWDDGWTIKSPRLWCPTLEAAKAVAQAHHVAQVMAAFGIDAEAMKEGKDNGHS